VTVGITSAPSRRAWSVPGFVPAIVLLVLAVTIGPRMGSLFRPLFVVGCGAAGWYAWRAGPAAHVQAVLYLFAFTPLARRIVDLSVGYDQTGIMLVGPLFAILAPLPQLRFYLAERPLRAGMMPILIVAASVGYAALLSMFQGDWFNAASGALKWMAPLIYAAALLREGDREKMVQAMASAFLIILPITGLIGVIQYINPPEWDRYWMQFAPITSVGYPRPYEVRVFSTMNGPASFATFTAAGLLMVCFLRSRWYLLLPALPAALALLLSLYRTAWLSLALGVLFCSLFAATRWRAMVILVGAVVAVGIAMSLPPFADVIGERLASLYQGTADGSAQERLEQYLSLWAQPDSSLFGIGFTVSDAGSAGAFAVDGMIIACWLSMGIVVGLLCLSGLVGATVRMIAAAWDDHRPESVLIGAMGCGAAVQIPLANVTSGELGFLFWTFAVLAALRPRASAGQVSR
jgi:hypothetical protein